MSGAWDRMPGPACSNPMLCELISWARVTRLASRLAERVSASMFRPDRVIAIARGGYVPARLLCDHLNLYELDSIRIAHYREGAARSPETRLVSPLTTELSGLDVLLVDDVADTGDTLEVAVKHLSSLGPKSLKVAVLQHKRQSPFLPDFSAEEVVTWRWLIYPWAVMEDLRGFMARMIPVPASAEELTARLDAEFGLKVSVRQARAVVASAGRSIRVPVAR